MRTAAPVDEFVDMTRALAAQRIREIATEVFSLLGTGQQVSLFFSRYPGFDLPLRRSRAGSRNARCPG